MAWQIQMEPPRLRSQIRQYARRLGKKPARTLLNADQPQAHRKTLFDIMTGFIPIENVKFDKRLTHVEQRPAGVTLTFSDGTTAEAAILAGADGIRSTTREHILKDLYPSQVAPVYAGAYCYRAVIPMPEAYEILGDLTDVAKLYFGPKRGVAEFNYLLCVADSDEGWKLKDAVTERTTHEAMMADFEDPGIDESFRKLLQRAKPVKWGLFHHLHTATYFRDRVVLIQWVIDAVQAEYSAFETLHESDGLVSTARELGIAYVAYGPLGHGWLVDVPTRRQTTSSPTTIGGKFQGENFYANKRIVDGFKDLATRKKCTLPQISRAWVAAQGMISIPGTTKPGRLEENWGREA
ncbi:hypothetical protein MW887_006946 [Aspergillus wentii]|nr:hypothetical protein MW887_006946 [Aspergillus wentii]